VGGYRILCYSNGEARMTKLNTSSDFWPTIIPFSISFDILGWYYIIWSNIFRYIYEKSIKNFWHFSLIIYNFIIFFQYYIFLAVITFVKACIWYNSSPWQHNKLHFILIKWNCPKTLSSTAAQYKWQSTKENNLSL
jgi:hypothetical protein